MMPMMASGQGDSVALETLETLPPWLWPIGPILPVSLPLPRWHQKNQSLRLTSRDSDVSNVAKLKNILSTYDYKIFQIQSPSIFHFPSCFPQPASAHLSSPPSHFQPVVVFVVSRSGLQVAPGHVSNGVSCRRWLRLAQLRVSLANKNWISWVYTYYDIHIMYTDRYIYIYR